MVFEIEKDSYGKPDLVYFIYADFFKIFLHSHTLYGLCYSCAKLILLLF